jgi:cellulose synthase/poly-beta-1,6-N-acetylglucosamine synthase-like glycosyltransferase
VESADSVGKGQALNLALRAAPATDLVAVYDADLTPRAGSLRILTAAFLDPRVAAATGYRRLSNAGQGPVAAYGASSPSSTNWLPRRAKTGSP